MYLPKPCRELDANARPGPIRTNKLSPLILVNRFGEAEYASNQGDKDALVARYDPSAGDQLLWAWVGNYRTDVFVLRKADLDRHYR